MDRFNDKLPTESVVLTFDFTRGLAPTEVLVGTPTLTVSDLYGGDTAPSAILNGPPVIGAAIRWCIESQGFVTGRMGTAVLVPVTAGVDLNDYIIVCECATSNVQKVLAWPGILPVRAYPSFLGNRL